jgi:hypothetical protein
MRHQTVLAYRDYRYLKLAIVVAMASLIAYLWAQPAGEGPRFPFGSTWTGYTLGTIGALLILWLLWFGVKKRTYRGSSAVKGWLSAHIYLGLSLLVVATLHTGFSFGLNVHTLAYGLMVLVIFSGIYGTYIYLVIPSAMSANLGEDSVEGLLSEIADLDRAAQKVALQLPDEVNRQVVKAGERTRIGGGFWRQVSGRQRRDPTVAAVALLEQLQTKFKGQQANDARELYSLMVRKKNLVERVRQEVRMRALLQLWLYFHVPVSIALLVALTAHIVSVFFYW